MFRSLLIMPLAILTLLAGCTSTGSSSFRDMSSAYRDVLESYANDNMLINIVRSSKNMPVSFLDMPSVVGTGNVSANAGVNAVVYGNTPNSLGGFFAPYNAPFTSSYSPSVSMSVNSGFNFTQSSLDNSSFMKAFLSDIQPEIISNLTNNQIGPKSILYSLVIDSIELRDRNNVIVSKFFNNPYLPNYQIFQKALYTLIEAGLSTETVMQQQVMSAPMDAEALNKNMQALVAAFAQPGTQIVPVKNKNGTNAFQLVRMMPATRMCLIRQDGLKVLGQNFEQSAYCNTTTTGVEKSSSPTEASAAAFVNSKLSDSKLVIKLRSTRNVFDFLGSLVDLQTKEDPVIITVMNSDDIERNPALIDVNEPRTPLFIIEKNKRDRNALASISYRGDNYTIPSQNNGYSNQVLVLLSQLLTLNKVPGSIPPSPSVLIK